MSALTQTTHASPYELDPLLIPRLLLHLLSIHFAVDLHEVILGALDDRLFRALIHGQVEATAHRRDQTRPDEVRVSRPRRREVVCQRKRESRHSAEGADVEGGKTGLLAEGVGGGLGAREGEEGGQGLGGEGVGYSLKVLSVAVAVHRRTPVVDETKDGIPSIGPGRPLPPASPRPWAWWRQRSMLLQMPTRIRL